MSAVVALKTDQSTERDVRMRLAACYRLIAHFGMDDLIYTHISARIPGTHEHFLINPYGMMFHEVRASDLVKIDKTIDSYLKKLAKQKGYDPMPFYAATYEQSLPAGLLRRAAMVSQSPQMIQQWVEEISNPLGAQPTWQALPHATRARALLAVEEYMKEH